MLFIFAISLSVGVSAEDISKKNISSKQNNILKTQGPFAVNDEFPQSYFLIPKNLPFMVGLTLFHPMNAFLDLSDEQVAQINKIKNKTSPIVTTKAKAIKAKELFLANAFIEGASVSDMEKLVDEISILRTNLTKNHLICIEKVRSILTPEQFKTLQGYASSKPD